VTLLDASCLIALAKDEPGAAEVESLLREGATAITSVNLLEVVDVLARKAAWPEDEVRMWLSFIAGPVIRVEPVGEQQAWTGAALRARYYEKKACELSLADCVLLASCRDGDAVATSDPAVARVAREEGIKLIALPDSRGQRP
jgi:predicted nucleic acid-binding protein